MKRAIRKHLPDFAAIVSLLIVAIGVSGYILSEQRLTAPKWVPVFGKDFYEFKAAFTTAQAVTPGQGQTVNVAGVEVGDISRVELVGGRAVVSMRIDRDKSSVRVFRDASVLLRPKTGLKDMVAQLDPGTRKAGELPEGATVPVSQTLPDVNLDEILAALDGDSREFLAVLVGAGAEGLRDGNGARLGQDLRRFEPLSRDLRRINAQLATRKRNISRVVHNLSLLSEELGGRDDQIAQLVDSSNAVFETLAGQDASLRSALRELPPTLRETQSALAKSEAFAEQLAPTAAALRPGARALAPSLRETRPFLRRTTPVIRDELRPFSRAALPLVSELRPAIRDLQSVTPDLQRSVSVLKALLNTLAYNPPGKEEGYLFWASWANHLAGTIFATRTPTDRSDAACSCSGAGLPACSTRSARSTRRSTCWSGC